MTQWFAGAGWWRMPLLLAAGAAGLARVPVATAANLSPGAVNWEAGQRPYRMLSEYGLFADADAHTQTQTQTQTQTPNDKLLPYDINTPLFTDYAAKHRFVWLPPGTTAQYEAAAPFAFPVGTIIVKTFAMPRDLRDPAAGERVLETRLLIHQPNGWVGLPYVWNAETTDARLRVAGTDIDVEWIHTDGTRRTNNYLVPNANQCKGCHENGDVMRPIGPKARNLNRDYAYADGVENQLARWTRAGYLAGAPPPDEAPRLAVWNDPATGDLDARARAYLEANCMHCHNPEGEANTSGLDLRADQTVPVRYGVFKTPVAAGRGSGGRKVNIFPGRPDDSFLLYRLESTEADVMMPELGRRLVHEEGVALIRAWITAMPMPFPAAAPAASAAAPPP